MVTALIVVVVFTSANVFALAFVGCHRWFSLGVQWHRLFWDPSRYIDEVWYWTKPRADRDRLRRFYPGRFDHIVEP